MLLTGFELGMRALVRKFKPEDLDEGDLIMFNDPYAGGQHVMDMVTFAPAHYKGELVGVEMPITVELEVTETGPGFKGDTATAGTKPATLETGITIQVPLFVNQGDVIKVDTRDGSYLERVS